MADQGRWFKLWVTAPYDIHLSNLSLENFARWCLFGVYLKTHGTNGVIEIEFPAIALQHLFRVNNYDEVVSIIKCFPSCNFTVTHVTTATVTWHNWLKYQGDYSGDRVRKFRDVKRTKKRREEKRREDIKKEYNKEENIKKKYGEFQNVLLTDEEYFKLQKKFNSALQDRIESLSQGIASKNYKYSSHYATILSWERKNSFKNLHKLSKTGLSLQAVDAVFKKGDKGDKYD